MSWVPDNSAGKATLEKRLNDLRRLGMKRSRRLNHLVIFLSFFLGGGIERASGFFQKNRGLVQVQRIYAYCIPGYFARDAQIKEW